MYILVVDLWCFHESQKNKLKQKQSVHEVTTITIGEGACVAGFFLIGPCEPLILKGSKNS